MLPVLCCLFSTRMLAQTAASYGFTAFTDTYVPITGGTSVSIMSDDITQTSIPIGFNFIFCGATYNTVSICSNGWISFANVSTTQLSNAQTSLSTITPAVMPLWDDLSGSGAQSASYVVTGTAPNRVFTMQWSQWLWNYTSSTNVISFQCKLYETSGIIKFYYSQGPNAPTNPSATIGIANSPTDWQTLNNSSASPVSSSTSFTDVINAKPATNQVYQYSPPSPCSSAPTATINGPNTYCPNQPFTLAAVTPTPLSGLTYQWESSPGGANTFTPIAGATAQSYTSPGINAPRDYRVILTCTNTTPAVSSTSPTKVMTQASFFSCYCSSNATSTADDDIGNVTITKQPNNVVLLNNGVATPLTSNPTSNKTYTDFKTTIPPVPLFRDSLYKTFVTQIDLNGFYTCTVAAYIDYNHSGTFDPTERIIYKVTSNASNPPQQVSDTFRVPSAALLGTTALRYVLVEGSNVAINPCGTYTWGETEDYLVDINFPPCNGPVNPGTAFISDTATCPGYGINLGDTTHETQRSQISWSWQQTINNGSYWSDMPGSAGKDTLQNVIVNVPTWYRLRMICQVTGDTTYSNVVKVSIGLPYQCYTYSQSNGGPSDSSDLGAFNIGSYVFTVPGGGPHLRNPQAIYRRTDNTRKPPIILYADSTYRLGMFHIMRGSNHADARITVFMDFNNDLQYNPGQQPNSELVFSGVTTAGNWYIDTSIRIPNVVIPNVPTGMRVILNNDVNPTAAANLGSGPFISGETEDYVIMFRRANAAGVGGVGNIQDLVLYPNPTGGQFMVDLSSARSLSQVDVEVTSMTGQKVFSRSFSATGTRFTGEIDLTSQARGVYFVQIKADGEKITRKLVIR